MAKNIKAIKISQKHLLGIQDLSVSDINYILDESETFIKLNQSKNKKIDVLRGKTQINLFFEPSTRTQSSFELAGKRLGAEVNIVAPTNLMPKEIEKFGVNTFTDMKKGLKDCDIVMMLRLQNERMTSSYLSSNREYYEYYGLTPDKLDHAKPDALIMHPGPMNRGIEIDTRLADDINKSVIKEQVELGVAVRMACLKIFCE